MRKPTPGLLLLGAALVSASGLILLTFWPDTDLGHLGLALMVATPVLAFSFIARRKIAHRCPRPPEPDIP